MRDILTNLSDDQLLSYLDIIVGLERRLNSEIESRANSRPEWPCPLAVSASIIYRGYTPKLPEPVPQDRRQKKVKEVEEIPGFSDDILGLLD